MSITSQSTRDYNRAINSALNSMVKIILETEYPKHYYIGRLKGFDFNTQGLVLEDVKDERNKKHDQIFIHGNKWVSCMLMGEPFPIEELAKRLRRILPSGSVKIEKDNTISCLNGKVKITEQGVKGKGPTYERIHKLYKNFVAELKATRSK